MKGAVPLHRPLTPMASEERAFPSTAGALTIHHVPDRKGPSLYEIPT